MLPPRPHYPPPSPSLVYLLSPKECAPLTAPSVRHKRLTSKGMGLSSGSNVSQLESARATASPLPTRAPPTLSHAACGRATRHGTTQRPCAILLTHPTMSGACTELCAAGIAIAPPTAPGSDGAADLESQRPALQDALQDALTTASKTSRSSLWLFACVMHLDIPSAPSTAGASAWPACNQFRSERKSVAAKVTAQSTPLSTTQGYVHRARLVLQCTQRAQACFQATAYEKLSLLHFSAVWQALHHAARSPCPEDSGAARTGPLVAHSHVA